VREECGNVLRIKFGWVALMMKENILFDPTEVSFFCPQAVMLEADDISDLIEEPGHSESTSGREINTGADG